MKLNTTIGSVLVLAIAVSGVHAQSTWEGPTGVFLNPLAINLAEGKTQVSTHYLNLQPLGSLTTLGVTYGVTDNLEVGITRADLSVGEQSEFNIFHAKYIALPFNDEAPAIALGAIVRDALGGSTTSDYYLVATKIFPTKVPIIANLTARYTNGIGSGLFGKNTGYSTQFGGFLGVVAKPNLIIGVEYYAQPEVDDWKDIAVRYTVNPNTFIDAGVARINSDLSNQFAVALTHQF